MNGTSFMGVFNALPGNFVSKDARRVFLLRSKGKTLETLTVSYWPTEDTLVASYEPNEEAEPQVRAMGTQDFWALLQIIEENWDSINLDTSTVLDSVLSEERRIRKGLTEGEITKIMSLLELEDEGEA